MSDKIGEIRCQHSIDVLSRLENAEGVSLEFYCRACALRTRKHHPKTSPQSKYELLVNVFCIPKLHERLGTFFGDLRINLQDPVTSSFDVPYDNPQLLLQENCVTMMSSLTARKPLEDFAAPADIFDNLLHTEALPEADTPRLIRTQLLR